jgi:hypothetical protein
MSASIEDLSRAIGARGFEFTASAAMRALLGAEPLAEWNAFAASWNDLGVDTFMADGGRYRRRRHATLCVTRDAITREPHQPHYQSRDYNALNGGIARWFEPVRDDVAQSRPLQGILHLCRDVFGALSPGIPAWHVELHQFRIEARPGVAGQPTPEGLHRDGVDWVLVLLINRRNIASGETSIHDDQRRKLGSFTLAEPLDAAWVDDHRVFHGVTPITPDTPDQPAYRDVLVVTFRRRYSA